MCLINSGNFSFAIFSYFGFKFLLLGQSSIKLAWEAETSKQPCVDKLWLSDWLSCLKANRKMAKT